MDPLSITTGCVALLTVVAQTTKAITDFIRAVRDARDDLTAVNRELSELAIVLELMKDDLAVDDTKIIPEPLQNQIESIVTNCTAVVAKINEILKGYKERSKLSTLKWITSGKGEIVGLRMSLEAHRASLNLALELMSITLSMAIKEDTSAIREDLIDIKQDTSQIPQIMEELETLRAMVSAFSISYDSPGQNHVLNQYLDGLTDYAESVLTDEGFESDQSDRESLGGSLAIAAPGEISQATIGWLDGQFSSASPLGMITWYGQFKCKPGQRNTQAWFKGRNDLSDANFKGRWEKVTRLLRGRIADQHEIWANCWRIGSAEFSWGYPSGFTALHQAAWFGAPKEVVQQLLRFGAWRLARTLRHSEQSAPRSTPYDIARDHGHAHLYELLEPVIRRPVDRKVLSELQRRLHQLIKDVFAHDNRAYLDCFILPETEVLTEFEGAGMWFPMDPELPNSRDGRGVDIFLRGTELEVSLYLGPTTSLRYHISAREVRILDTLGTI